MIVTHNIILSKRHEGKIILPLERLILAEYRSTTVDFKSADPQILLYTINDFLIQGKYSSLEDDWKKNHWQEINKTQASSLLLNLLQISPAYQLRFRNLNEAKKITDIYFGYCENYVRYFTNTDYFKDLDENGVSTNVKAMKTFGKPITEATFECGVLGLSETRVIFLWSIDED